MTTPLSARLDRSVEALPHAYPGPGGAIAVLRDGEVLVRHAWGWANAERRIPFTPRTLFRMCSITKQFTCSLVLDAFPDPSVLDGDVSARLPLLEQPAPGALHLCHNQSGLRDYWAVAMLHGSPVEAPFGDTEAARVIAETRTLQFAPGTRCSYVNQNFRILSDILQERTGRSFAELLRTRIFERVGMDTALLTADTRAMPDGTEGYEGAPTGGFRAAENRIVWTGDAGLGACLDDMIAWERHIDATREDAGALYARLSVPVSFADGAPAVYGFGLNRATELGRLVTGHGGALRGWRSHRLYVPSVGLAIVSNQPAAAKGKTTRDNLEKATARVIELAQAAGGRILSAHICYHRSEDNCPCRKPKTGLLEEAFAQNPGFAKDASWMVGDGVTDIQAGQTFGIKTAMIARYKVEAVEFLKGKGAVPDLWADDLLDFSAQILDNKKKE